MQPKRIRQEARVCVTGALQAATVQATPQHWVVLLAQLVLQIVVRTLLVQSIHTLTPNQHFVVHVLLAATVLAAPQRYHVL